MVKLMILCAKENWSVCKRNMTLDCIWFDEVFWPYYTEHNLMMFRTQVDVCLITSMIY